MAGRILVVDDDKDIRETVIEVLEAEGYGAQGAADGQQALEHLRQKGKPDLILLDLMMPVMSGQEFCLALRQDPSLAGIPVVVISADPRASEKAVAMGANDILQKPLELMKLLHTIERICNEPH